MISSRQHNNARSVYTLQLQRTSPAITAIILDQLILHCTMSPAELSLNGSSSPVEGKGYNGRNMTLPASWWTSTPLFQLERRAIFAKVPPPPLFGSNRDRHGCTQPTLLISRT